MEDKQITVRVPPNPAKMPTQVSVSGVKGQGCEQLTAGVLKALGVVVGDEKTSEFYERPMDQENQQQVGA